MTKTLESSLLAAYADGALDAEKASEVEARLGIDPAAREELRWLEESRSLLQSAYAEIADEALPERLRAVVEGRAQKIRPEDLPSGGRPTAATGGSWHRAWPMVAASLLAFLVGLPSGYLLSDLRHGRELTRYEELRAADQQAMAAAVANALEKHLSGHSVDWQVPASGSHGSVTPVRSFRNADGSWCREYRHRMITDRGHEDRRAIACRTENGNWQTRLIAIDES